MSSGRINSPESIRLGRRMVRAFGGWDALERAAMVTSDGVHVIRMSDLEQAEELRKSNGH